MKLVSGGEAGDFSVGTDGMVVLRGCWPATCNALDVIYPLKIIDLSVRLRPIIHQ